MGLYPGHSELQGELVERIVLEAEAIIKARLVGMAA